MFHSTYICDKYVYLKHVIAINFQYSKLSHLYICSIASISLTNQWHTYASMKRAIIGTGNGLSPGRSKTLSLQALGRNTCTLYPNKYAHGFVVLCFVAVMQSFIMNSHEVSIHIHQGCFAGTGAIVRLPQCQWSKPDGYGKIGQCITTTKHSKAKIVCIYLEIYCSNESKGRKNESEYYLQNISHLLQLYVSIATCSDLCYESL